MLSYSANEQFFRNKPEKGREGGKEEEGATVYCQQGPPHSFAVGRVSGRSKAFRDLQVGLHSSR